jgi:predicted DNA-binding transcriptional regulator AlpA
MRQQMTDPDALLPEIQAAILLNLSSRTLQAWRSKSVGPPFVRAGRAIRYRRSDILAWIETKVVMSANVAEDVGSAVQG